MHFPTQALISSPSSADKNWIKEMIRKREKDIGGHFLSGSSTPLDENFLRSYREMSNGDCFLLFFFSFFSLPPFVLVATSNLFGREGGRVGGVRQMKERGGKRSEVRENGKGEWTWRRLGLFG